MPGRHLAEEDPLEEGRPAGRDRPRLVARSSGRLRPRTRPRGRLERVLPLGQRGLRRFRPGPPGRHHPLGIGAHRPTPSDRVKSPGDTPTIIGETAPPWQRTKRTPGAEADDRGFRGTSTASRPEVASGGMTPKSSPTNHAIRPREIAIVFGTNLGPTPTRSKDRAGGARRAAERGRPVGSFRARSSGRARRPGPLAKGVRIHNIFFNNGLSKEVDEAGRATGLPPGDRLRRRDGPQLARTNPMAGGNHCSFVSRYFAISGAFVEARRNRLG